MSLIQQLNAASAAVRSDPGQYAAVLRNVLPVADHPDDEVRRWCGGFVSNFFCSDDIKEAQKEELAPEMLNAVSVWVDDANAQVAKLGIEVLAEIYPRIYSRAAAAPGTSATASRSKEWKRLISIKNRALEAWHTRSNCEGIAVSCIKLAQVIILAHRADLLPRSHPFVDSVTLTAESAGLLDRMLAIFAPPGPTSPRILSYQQLSATLVSVIGIAINRPDLTGRIVQFVVGFDLSKREVGTAEHAQSPIILRWVAKTFKLVLQPLAKQHPAVGRYLAGLTRYCANQTLRKEALVDHKTPQDETKPPLKRARTTLEAGPVPYKALYSLEDTSMAGFTARDLDLPLAINMTVAALTRIPTDTLKDCASMVRQRLANITSSPEDSANPPPAKRVKPSEDVVTATKELGAFNDTVDRLFTEAPPRVIVRLAARGVGTKSPAHAALRDRLYKHLLGDFRNQHETIVLWLSEEYYADTTPNKTHYSDMVLRVVEEVLPKLDLSDSKIFVRLLSELPELPRDAVFKIRSVSLDPERTLLGARALKFLIMFKPPCRNDCLDLAQELVNQGVKNVEGVLRKYRPQAAT